MRDFFHESDVIRHPPLGDFALQKGQQFLFARFLSRLEDNDQQRPLIPFRVPHPDDGGFVDVGVQPEDRLDFGRVDVLAAGYDHVLLSTRDPEVAVGGDRGEQEPVWERARMPGASPGS